MFRILIVDDEHLILNGCGFMIQEILNFPFPVEVQLANNVPEALSLLENEVMPDLILTDIRMPVMDGFVLIEYVQKHQINSEIVVLTSHSDFEYARTALRYHVSDFILKPINEDALQQLILNVYQKRQTAVSELRNRAYSQLLTMTLYSVSFSDLLLTDEMMDSVFPYAYFTVIVIEQKAGRPDCTACENLLLNYYRACHCYYVEDRHQIICICNHDVFSVKSSSFQKQFYQLLGTDFLLGISISSNSVKKLHQLYSNACQRIFYKKVFGDDELMIATASFSYHDCIRIFTETDSHNIPDLLEDYTERLQLIDNPSSKYLEQIFMSFFQNISLFLENSGLEALPPSDLLPSCPIQNKAELIQAIIEKIKGIKNESNILMKESKETLLINQLVLYIQDHYQNDIALDDLAASVNLHPNYVSSCFKKITGESYLTCLHKERIKAAKKLLKNSSLTIEEIARQVGYNSSSQFARIFRKYEQISPSDYKNK